MQINAYDQYQSTCICLELLHYGIRIVIMVLKVKAVINII